MPRSRPHPIDSPAEFALLTDLEQRALLIWISIAMRPAKTPDRRTSYGIKHDFDDWRDKRLGFYVTNGAFKGAMLAAGYAPVDPAAPNWIFRTRPAKRRRHFGWYHPDADHPRLGELIEAVALVRAARAPQRPRLVLLRGGRADAPSAAVIATDDNPEAA